MFKKPEIEIYRIEFDDIIVTSSPYDDIPLLPGEDWDYPEE